MPANFLMTWDSEHRRWTKKTPDGKHYSVSCRQLSKLTGDDVPGTKEGSYQAANRWWESKLAELETQATAHPHASDIVEYRRRRDYCRSRGDNKGAEHWEGLAAALEDHPAPNRLVPTTENLAYHRMEVARVKIEAGVSEPKEWDSQTAVWAERLSDDLNPVAPDDLTIGYQVDRYLDLERTRVDANQLSASEYDLIRLCLTHFRDWIGPQIPVGQIIADKWEAYWSLLTGSKISIEYKKKRFRHARAFVEWLTSKGKIPALPNLHSRRYRFGGGVKSVPTMTVDEVKRLIAEAPGQLKLHLLLMLNCGMTQTDISDLQKDEVDWEEGRIIRKRSKTRDQSADVPTVSYKLWPATLALLKTYRQSEGNHVLLTESGREWVRDSITAKGTRSKVDAIKSNYVHLARRLDFKKSMKLLRKTSATFLRDFPEFSPPLVRHFLGHTPKDVDEINYAPTSAAQFDRALTWLGVQFGFVDPPALPKRKPKPAK